MKKSTFPDREGKRGKLPNFVQDKIFPFVQIKGASLLCNERTLSEKYWTSSPSRFTKMAPTVPSLLCSPSQAPSLKISQVLTLVDSLEVPTKLGPSKTL